MDETCRFELTDKPIDVKALRSNFCVPAACGGYVAFEGIIRNDNHGKEVIHLEYEVYRELALKELARLTSLAQKEFKLSRVHGVHRFGRLEIGDTAVMIQVAAPHRTECFLGCKFLIDQLKASVPIWKHEFYADGSKAWTRCSEHG
ncbi:MAG: molybdenum cofactor biosynthesis protein MoaE [Bdellovibrionota bacterium]